MDAGGPPGAPGDRGPRPRGGAPCLLDRVWAPWPISFAHKSLLNPKSCFVESQVFWSCGIGFQRLLLFQPEFQLPAFPLFMVNLVK